MNDMELLRMTIVNWFRYTWSVVTKNCIFYASLFVGFRPPWNWFSFFCKNILVMEIVRLTEIRFVWVPIFWIAQKIDFETLFEQGPLANFYDFFKVLRPVLHSKTKTWVSGSTLSNTTTYIISKNKQSHLPRKKNRNRLEIKIIFEG